MIRLGERAALPDALIILRGITVDNLVLCHLNAEVLFYEINGGEDRTKRVPLATSGTADITDQSKGF